MPSNNAPRPPAGFDDLASFGDFSADDARAESDVLKDFALSNGKMLGKFAEGATPLRVLPKRPDSNQQTCFYTVFEHFFDVGRSSASFYCPRMMSGGKMPCPACKESAALMASKSKADQDRGKNMRASQKFLANVVVRGKEDALGVKVWKGSGRQQESMLKFQSEMGVNFSNPVYGQDIIVMRTGQGLKTEYELHLNPKGPSRLAKTPEKMRAILEQMHDLQSVPVLLSPADIQAKMEGRETTPGTSRGGQSAAPAWAGSAGRTFGSRGANAAPPAQDESEDEEDLSALDDDDGAGDEGDGY